MPLTIELNTRQFQSRFLELMEVPALADGFGHLCFQLQLRLNVNFFNMVPAEELAELLIVRHKLSSTLSTAQLNYLNQCIVSFARKHNLNVPSSTPAPIIIHVPEEKPLTFTEQLNDLMGAPVTNANFRNGLEPFLNLAFFNSGPRERLRILNELRYNTDFISVLQIDRGLTRTFLQRSLSNEPALLREILTNRLGQQFLLRQPLQFTNNPVGFHSGNQNLRLEELERRLIRFVLARSEREQRPAGPRLQLAQQDINASAIIGRHVGEDTDWLIDFRCPITQSLITGEVVQVKMANGQMKYFDAVELRKHVSQHHQNPLNRARLELDGLLPAPNYRQEVLAKIQEKLIRDYREAGISAEGAKNRAKEVLENIKVELKWTNVPQVSLQSA